MWFPGIVKNMIFFICVESLTDTCIELSKATGQQPVFGRFRHVLQFVNLQYIYYKEESIPEPIDISNNQSINHQIKQFNKSIKSINHINQQIIPKLIKLKTTLDLQESISTCRNSS